MDLVEDDRGRQSEMIKVDYDAGENDQSDDHVENYNMYHL